MIVVTKGLARQEFADHLLPNICLQLAGGGYSESQTRKAMALQAQVETKGEGRLRGVIVRKV